MLVSISLFSIVMMISVGTLLALVDANRKAQNVSTITTNLHFALDLMSRTIRTGTNYYCADKTMPPGHANTSKGDCPPGGGQALSFVDQAGVLTAYVYDDSRRTIYRIQDTDADGKLNGGETKEDMTATTQLQIVNMRFFVDGTNRYTDGGSDNKTQPFVRILVQALAGTDPDTSATMNIETTIVQRALDL